MTHSFPTRRPSDRTSFAVRTGLLSTSDNSTASRASVAPRAGFTPSPAPERPTPKRGGQRRECPPLRTGRRVLCHPAFCSGARGTPPARTAQRSEEHTSELQSLMRISYAVFCLKKKKNTHDDTTKSNSEKT